MGNVYSCETCGLTTTAKGHLCKPVIAQKEYVCKSCGTSTGDPRHICAPKLVNLKYVCSSCGRLSPKRELLCNPSPIAKPKKIAQKPAAKKKAKSKK